MAYRDDLQAALSRAEAAERRLEARCAAHPSLQVAATCARCEAGACEACAMPRGDGTTWCTRCFVARRDRVARARLAATILIAASAGAAATAMLSRQRVAPELEKLRPPPSLAVARPTSFAVEQAREALARSPCVVDRAVALATALRGIDDHRGVIATIAAFEDRCGPAGGLRWEEAQARVALGEPDGALAALDALVADPGADAVNLPVILHLRGVVGERLRRLEQAAADLASAVPVADAEWRLAEVGEALGRPCDGAFAVLAWEPPGDAATQRRLDDLLARGGCAALAWRGAATFAFTPDDGPLHAEGAIGAAPARMVVDERAPYVVVSTALAADAGLVASGQTIEASVFGKPRRAALAVAERVSLGGASADRVVVAIVDGEPAPGVAAVAGGSFLWRFEAAIDRDAGRLTLRAR